MHPTPSLLRMYILGSDMDVATHITLMLHLLAAVVTRSAQLSLSEEQLW